MCAIEAHFDDNYDPENMGFDGPVAGNYHVALVYCNEDGGKKGEMVCDYEVLAGSVAGQEGKRHRDYFTKSIKAMGRIHQLAMALGMVTAQQLKEMKDTGRAPVYDFVAAAEQKTQLCVALTNEEYNGKTSVKCGFGIFHVTDERTKTWKKNAAMLQAAGYAVKPQASATSTAANQAAPDNSNLLDGVI